MSRHDSARHQCGRSAWKGWSAMAASDASKTACDSLRGGRGRRLCVIRTGSAVRASNFAGGTGAHGRPFAQHETFVSVADNRQNLRRLLGARTGHLQLRPTSHHMTAEPSARRPLISNELCRSIPLLYIHL